MASSKVVHSGGLHYCYCLAFAAGSSVYTRKGWIDSGFLLAKRSAISFDIFQYKF